MKSRDRPLEISISRDEIVAVPVPHKSLNAWDRRETSIARRSSPQRKTWRTEQQLEPSFCAYQNEWRFHRRLPNCTGKLSVFQLPLKAESDLVRLDRHQIAFLPDKIYRQNVVFPPDNHKIRRRAIGVIRKLDRHVTCVAKHFIIAFPFALDLLCH